MKKQSWWSNYCLKETFYIFKRKGSKEVLQQWKRSYASLIFIKISRSRKKKLTLILLPQHVTLSLLTASGNNLLFSILRNQLKFPLSLSPLLCKNICIILDPWVMSLKAICLFLPLSSLWMTEARYHKELCGFPISYQKQQTLEQCVHKGRSDNPPVYCFTCHLQVTHSTHAIHSGQQS